MQPTRAILMLGLCLAILGPIWPKALVKVLTHPVHPTEGVMVQDDVSDADDSLPGILPVAAMPGVEPVRCSGEPPVPPTQAAEPFRIPTGPRSPPASIPA